MNLEPNWASPPGETVTQLRSRNGLSRSELGRFLALTDNEMLALSCGTLRISDDLAQSLSDALGSTPRFWLKRDAQFLEDRKRLNSIEDQSSLQEWAKGFPVVSLKKLGLLPSNGKRGQSTGDLLGYFGCANLTEWKKKYSGGIGAVAFRTSFAFTADEMATLAWLRAGELQLDEIDALRFDPKGFEGCLSEVKRLAALKHPKIFFPRLQAICAQHGVKVVSGRAPSGCRASGASWFDANGSPVIMLSFRHLSDDHFWFTFFHEAAHILLHGGYHIDVDGADPSPLYDSEIEAEADAFAQSILVPEELNNELHSLTANRRGIIAFARRAGVTAGIVVGQLQKRGILRHEQMNFLKRRYRWGDDFRIPGCA